MAGITDVEQRADELNRRTAVVFAAEADLGELT